MFRNEINPGWRHITTDLTEKPKKNLLRGQMNSSNE